MVRRGMSCRAPKKSRRTTRHQQSLVCRTECAMARPLPEAASIAPVPSEKAPRQSVLARAAGGGPGHPGPHGWPATRTAWPVAGARVWAQAATPPTIVIPAVPRDQLLPTHRWHISVKLCQAMAAFPINLANTVAQWAAGSGRCVILARSLLSAAAQLCAVGNKGEFSCVQCFLRP